MNSHRALTQEMRDTQNYRDFFFQPEPGRGAWGITEDFIGLAFNKSTEGPQKMHGCVSSKQIVGHLFNNIHI